MGGNHHEAASAIHHGRGLLTCFAGRVYSSRVNGPSVAEPGCLAALAARGRAGGGEQDHCAGIVDVEAVQGRREQGQVRRAIAAPIDNDERAPACHGTRR